MSPFFCFPPAGLGKWLREMPPAGSTVSRREAVLQAVYFMSHAQSTWDPVICHGPLACRRAEAWHPQTHVSLAASYSGGTLSSLPLVRNLCSRDGNGRWERTPRGPASCPSRRRSLFIRCCWRAPPGYACRVPDFSLCIAVLLGPFAQSRGHVVPTDTTTARPSF